MFNPLIQSVMKNATFQNAIVEMTVVDATVIRDAVRYYYETKVAGTNAKQDWKNFYKMHCEEIEQICQQIITGLPF